MLVSDGVDHTDASAHRNAELVFLVVPYSDQGSNWRCHLDIHRGHDLGVWSSERGGRERMTNSRFVWVMRRVTLSGFMCPHLGRACGTGQFASCSRHAPDMSVSEKLPRSRARLGATCRASIRRGCNPAWVVVGRLWNACTQLRSASKF